MGVNSSVLLVMGPPGAGKTSFLRQLHSRLGDRSTLVSSARIRSDLNALDLLSADDKRVITREVSRVVSRELAAASSFILVDMNAFLAFQRRAILEVARGMSAGVGLLQFEVAEHDSRESVRRKVEVDPTYAHFEGDIERYLDQVANWAEAPSSEEDFDMTATVDIRRRRIVGDAFGLGEELGEALLDVLSRGIRDTSSLSGPYVERVVHEEVILQSPKFDVITTRVAVSDGGVEERTYARKRDYVGVIARDADGRIMLTREFRSASASTSWGIPGGAREEGEQVRVAAAREFSEESGFRANSMALLYGEPSVSASIIEMNWLFVADDPEHTGLVAIDGSRISVLWAEPREVLKLLLSGGFQDKVAAALLRYMAPWLSEALELNRA